MVYRIFVYKSKYNIRFDMISADIFAQINAEWYFQYAIQKLKQYGCRDAYTLSGYHKKEFVK